MGAAHIFEVWNADVRQDYLQSNKPMSGLVFVVKVAFKLNLTFDKAPKLLKPLYRLSESDDHWLQTLDSHQRKVLGTNALCSNLVFYLNREGGNEKGLYATCVNNTLRVGTKKKSARYPG